VKAAIDMLPYSKQDCWFFYITATVKAAINLLHTPNRNISKEFNEKTSHQANLNLESYHFGCWCLLAPFDHFYLRNNELGQLLLTNAGRKFHKESK
jgi:hypothetical protein